MGKTVGGQPEAHAVTPRASAGGREPIGRYLAQQRKLRGLSLDELSTQTRIPRRSLERLEAGAFDRTPDGFARGFVRTVAEAIGLDPDETVARMLEEPTGAVRTLPRAGGAVFVLAAAALVALLAYAASNLEFGSSSEPALAEPAAGLPVRRDYVRELAEARGLAPATLEAADAALPAEPPAPEAPVADVAAPALASDPAAAPERNAAPPAASNAVSPAIAPPAAPLSAPLAATPPEAGAVEPLAVPDPSVADAAQAAGAAAAEPPAPDTAAAPLEAPAPPGETALPAAEPPASAPAVLEAQEQAAPAAEASEAAPAPPDAASERAEDPD